MDDEELLEKAKAVAAVEDLSGDDRELVEKVLELIRQEKKVSKKYREAIKEMYAEHVDQKEGPASDDDVDEDDFV